MNYKSILVGSALALSLTTFLPQGATKANAEEIQQQENSTFSYEYNGVEFESDSQLNEAQLPDLFKMVSGKNDSGISPFIVAPDEPGVVMIDQPYYRTYSNMEVRALITAVAAWITTKIPLTKAQSNQLTVAVFGATEKVTPTYVGTWRYKSYDNVYKRYRMYATLVHYKHSNYSSPKKVQVLDLGLM